MSQYQGTVKWFNNAKGYGFLGHEGGPDVFVHYSSIQLAGYRSLNAGDEVSFDVVQGDKGPQADTVKRVSKSQAGGESMGQQVSTVPEISAGQKPLADTMASDPENLVI